jgi:tetratricopeptide (TPR) repeat protein
MNHTASIIVILLLMLLPAGCSTDRADETLAAAQQMMAQYPDSALTLLHSISNTDRLNEEQQHLFQLLQVQAKDKTYKDITGDSVIFRVRDYYRNRNNLEYLPLASFYCGRVWEYRQEDTLAINEYLEAGKYAVRTGNDALNGLVESSIGSILSYNMMNMDAIKHLMKAVKYFHSAKSTMNEIVCYNQIGNAYLIESMNDSAFHYYHQGLELAKLTNDSLGIADLMHNLGVAYRETGRYELAEKYIRDAAKHSVSDTTYTVKQYINLSKTFYERNMLDSAAMYIQRSHALVLNDEDPFVSAEIYLTLSNISERQSDLKQALEYHKQYATHIAKIVDENMNKEIIELQKKYDNERLQNINNNLEIRTLFLVWILLGVVLIAVLFYLKSVRKHRDLLKKENELLQKNNELLELEKRVVQLVDMQKKYQDKEMSYRNLLLQRLDIFKRIVTLLSYQQKDNENSQQLITKINQIIYGQDSINLELFCQDMNELNNGLYTRLKELHPELDENELRICNLWYANFTCKESGIIMELSAHTIEMKRCSIRKKIGIEVRGNMQAYMALLLNDDS